MRIATRLILILGGIVVALGAAYMLISHQQRQALLREALERQTETIARTLQVVGEDALRAGRLDLLDRALRTALEDGEVSAAVVLDAQGELLAGGAEELACLVRHLPAAPPTVSAVIGRASCGARSYWVALPLPPPAARLLVARSEALLERAVAAALGRQLLLILTLMAAVGLAVAGILHRTLTAPLESILRGFRSAEATGRLPRLQLSRSSGELVLLAEGFNQMAEQLERHRQQLLQEAEERLALERQLRQAEQLAAIGRLSGGLAHELGSPLSVISMRAGALEAAPELPEALREQARAIARMVEAMTEFVQGLLHVARRQGIVFLAVELVRLVESLAEELVPYCEADNVQLEVTLPPHPVWIRGEEILLRHVLRNLVRNAVHALRRQPGERRIRIGVGTTSYEIRLWVEDTGPGIAPEHLEQVFDPFFSTKPAGEGLGLGLAVSRAIVEEHGGELILENRAQGGVRALVVLPLPPAERSLTPGG